MRLRFCWIVLLCLASSLFDIQPADAQGIILSGGGPVNRSMGGASVAAPIDAIGAIYWNPASISGMAQSEMSVGLDLLFPNHTIESTIGGFSGSSEADIGALPIPNVGVVHKTSNERLTLGAGVNAVAGLGTNFAASTTNPILAPPPTGLGQVSSQALFLQIAPILSYAVTEKLSLAAGPTITTGRVTLEPFVLDSANADGTYSAGNATRYHWGSGFQLGAYYIFNEQWRLGASFKSPVWMERFEFNALDENGLPRKLLADLDLPMILSGGLSYSPRDSTLIALDLRYLDYQNTDGLGDTAEYDATGALGGLGWDSVMSLALGVQQVVSDQIVVRAGYTFNQNPVNEDEAFFNIASPLFYQHMLACGLSYNLSEDFVANVGYSHFLDSSRTGPIVLPGVGPVPGSEFTNTLDVHGFSFGLTMKN